MIYHGCLENAEMFLDFFAPWASQNNLVLLLPQSVNCWGVHGGTDRTPKDIKDMSENYFTKNYSQYKFTKSLIKAVGAPIDPKFDYTKRQNIKRNSTYPEEYWQWAG